MWIRKDQGSGAAAARRTRVFDYKNLVVILCGNIETIVRGVIGETCRAYHKCGGIETKSISRCDRRRRAHAEDTFLKRYVQTCDRAVKNIGDEQLCGISLIVDCQTPRAVDPCGYRMDLVA